MLAGFGNEDAFIDPILSSSYRGRIADAAEFARRNRVLLIESPGGVPIDIALGGLPFEALAIDRATPYDFEPDCVLTTCSAEDLMVLKLFAFRPRDVLDVEGIVVRQRGRLDWDYIEAQLTPLAELKGQPDILRTLARFKRQDE